MSALVGGNGADDCHSSTRTELLLRMQATSFIPHPSSLILTFAHPSSLFLYGIEVKAEAGAVAGFDFDELDGLVAIA